MLIHVPISSKNWLWRTNPDGTRDISWRMWLLVWVLPGTLALAAIGLIGEAFYKTRMSTPVTAVVDKVYSWPGTVPITGEEVINYSPRFVFTDETGRVTAATSGQSDPSLNFAVGTEMEIRYFPGSNANIVIPGPLNWFVAKVIALLAVAALPFSLVLTWWLRHWQKRGRKT
ncbi:MAG TPA: hypothetical protein ENK28_13465 [Aliiroseovarius sp.]|nr:hypothetical protein [Aliiroseovarius sp.]